MVRTGPTKTVSSSHVLGRLRKARKFMDIARNEMELADKSDETDPIVSNMILGAIAYADSLTAVTIGEVNQGDHAGVIKVVRKALGDGFPKAQEGHLKALLQRKDQSQYGSAFGPYQAAESLLKHAEEFSNWAERELKRIQPGLENTQHKTQK